MAPAQLYDTICALPVTSDIFTQAIHPSVSLVAIGTSSGHVQTFRLPIDATNRHSPSFHGADAHEDSDDDEKRIKRPRPSSSALRRASPNGFGTIATQWRTRRHKGSCRSVAYSHDGNTLFSAGTDGIIKAASSATGQVHSKFAIPRGDDEDEEPALLHALTPQTLLLATDTSALHVLDLRASDASFAKPRPAQTWFPHEDYVSSLQPLPPSETSTSGLPKQWVTTGGTKLAVTDLRRGVLVQSEDQEEELLSSVLVEGVRSGKRGSGDVLVVGGGGGVLTLWDKGVWDDQEGRIIVDDGKRTTGTALVAGPESLDVLAEAPITHGGKVVAVGMGDGKIRFVELKQNRVIDELVHDEVEGVVGIGFDVRGRMVTAGGRTVKVWSPKVTGERDNADADEDEDEDNEDKVPNGVSDDEEDSSDEEKQAQHRRKRRKKGKGKQGDPGHGVASIAGLM